MDPELAALEAEFVALQSALNESTPQTSLSQPSMVKQGLFDIGAGLAGAGAGIVDVLSLPAVAAARGFGADPETTRYFALTKELQKAKEAIAPEFGVEPENWRQQLIEFITPSPLSKAKLLSQAGTGLASYLGMQGAEAIAPDSQYAGLVGALAAPAAVSGAAKLAGAAAPALEEAGLGLQRRALGITKADYKNAKNAVIETVSGDFSTQLKESVDDLIKNKTLGTSLNPGAMFAELQGAKSATEDAIQATLKAAESKIGPVPPPNFDKTIDYISKNIAADQVDKYVNNVIEFQDALRREGQGSLTYLNQQKKIIGENWKNSPQSDPGFWRTIYGDVKRHIEKYAPEVKDLNKEKQKLILAEPVVTRNFKASGGDYDIGALQRLLNTTGGAGLAGGAIVGAATGSLTRGVAGALALRGLATPTGQNIVGRGLRGTASLAEALGGAKLDIGQTLQRAGVAAGNAQTPVTPTRSSTPTQDPETAALEAELQALKEQMPKEAVKVGKQNVSIPTGEKYAPPSLVKAVIQVESAGKPEAVSSKGAAGLMQLMPATAKQLGIADRFDPEQNVEGGSRYLQQMLNKYGKTDIALAAYNWGPGNIDKAIKQVKADGKRVTWANIMQAVKVPQETRLYVNKVLNKEQEALTEQTSPSLLRTVASFAPITGEIISAEDAINALRAGDYSNAAINAVGVIPAVGLFNRIRKGAKLVDAVSDVTKAAPLTEADILYNRANKALRDIDINSLTNSLKSKQTLQNTYAELVEKTRARLARGFNKGKSKSWMDEQVAYLNENKAKLDAITTEINDTQQLLQNVIGLKQVK